MFIRSERLFLRPAWPEDAAELHPLVDDEALARMVRVPWPYRLDDARAYAAMPQAPRYPHFVITLPQAPGGARLVGTVGFAPFEGEVELGYWIARDCWDRGYATEAVRAALSIARTLGHCRIIASHFADNHASRRVLAKLGFVPAGERSGRPAAVAQGGLIRRSCCVCGGPALDGRKWFCANVSARRKAGSPRSKRPGCC